MILLKDLVIKYDVTRRSWKSQLLRFRVTSNDELKLYYGVSRTIKSNLGSLATEYGGGDKKRGQNLIIGWSQKIFDFRRPPTLEDRSSARSNAAGRGISFHFDKVRNTFEIQITSPVTNENVKFKIYSCYFCWHFRFWLRRELVKFS